MFKDNKFAVMAGGKEIVCDVLFTHHSEQTGKELSVIERDTERDNYMSADEACAYGLVDKVITKKEI